MAAAVGQVRAGPAGWLSEIWSWQVTTLRVMARNKVGFAGFITVLAILLVAYLGPLLVEPDERADVTAIYQGPSREHWLGTDSEGKDVFAQVINGGRPVISVGLLSAVMSTAIALVFGSLSAYVGGWIDAATTWLADVFLTIPQFALLAVLAGVVTLNNEPSLAAVIAIFSWPTLLRAVRAQVLSLKERDYIESARALGLDTKHILFREIAPNMIGYIAINFTLALTAGMYASVGLILLGLAPLQGQNWGLMIYFAGERGAIFFRDSVWYLMAPIVVITLFQLGLVAMSRSLSEAFDPRLRRGG